MHREVLAYNFLVFNLKVRHLLSCCRKITDLLQEIIEDLNSNGISYKDEIDELIDSLTAMNTHTSEGENVEDGSADKSKNSDDQDISVKAEARDTTACASEIQSETNAIPANLGGELVKPKKGNKKMPAITKLVDGDFNSFKDSLLCKEHFLSVWLLMNHFCKLVLYTAKFSIYFI